MINRLQIIRILLTTVLLCIAVAIDHRVESLTTVQRLLIFLVPYLFIGYDVIMEAFEAIVKGRALDENFLMVVATVGAMLIGFLPGGEPQFAEAVFVLLLFQVGEFFEELAEDRSRHSIDELIEQGEREATVVRNGQQCRVRPENIGIGETVIVRPGETIPVDGKIVRGRSTLNCAMLTGESLPRDVEAGDAVSQGCVNLSGLISIRSTRHFSESATSQLINLVQSAGDRKARSERFITHFSRVYTPIVVIAAFVLAFLPPLFYESYSAHLVDWLHRALMFLVVSCPCALVVSVPLTFFGGIGGAARKGILVKGANFIDALSKTATVVFDKTGTLTKGEFDVTAVHPEKMSEKELLHLAVDVERHSNHPIARALKRAFPDENCKFKIEKMEEMAGLGARATVNGHVVCVGNGALMEKIGADWHACHKVGTTVHVAVDGEYAGHIVVADTVKDDAKEAIDRLHGLGVAHTALLTGDAPAVAEEVAKSVGLDEWHASLLPEGKMAEVERMLGEKRKGGSLVFVGDGTNDAPVLARADVGVAMGAMGSQAAIEAADVVIMDDAPQKVATAITLARRTLRIARQNVSMAIIVKILALGIAAAGFGTLWLMALADVGICVVCILNASRTFRTRGY